MKKLLFLAGMMLILVTHVEAAPTFLGSSTLNTGGTYDTITHTIDGTAYTVNNRSRESDIFDSSYGGYRNTDFSGFYIGTIAKDNDSTTDIANLVKLFLNDDSFGISEYAKTEISDSGTMTYDNPDFKIDITVDGDKQSGTWTLVSSVSDQKISFYSVKGGTEYALYYLDPAAATGTWIMDHVLNGGDNLPAISHFAGVLSTTNEPPDAVPEPATMLLLGFGLIGLAGIGRKTG